jgi:hypothetical protein
MIRLPHQQAKTQSDSHTHLRLMMLHAKLITHDLVFMEWLLQSPA